MTNTAQAASVIPFQFNNTEVRVIEIDNQIWFVASDIAAILKYRDAQNMIRILDDDEADTHTVSTRSENGVVQNREVTIINESGFYHAVLKSRKPEAKPVRRWVTSEVLPSIRKTGKYEAPNLKTKKTIPNGLSADQCDSLKALVKARVESLPKDKQAKAAITCWSALKSKFGCTYKAIEPQYFSDALSLVARLPLEGELLDAEPKQTAINVREIMMGTLPHAVEMPTTIQQMIDEKAFAMGHEAYEISREYLARKATHSAYMGSPKAINHNFAEAAIKSASLDSALAEKYFQNIFSIQLNAKLALGFATEFHNAIDGILSFDNKGDAARIVRR